MLIFLLAFALVRPAAAQFVCSAYYLSGFDDRLPEGDCEEAHTVPITGPLGTSTLRILRYAGPTHGPDDWIPMVDELAARVGAAMRAMGGVRLQETVSVFLVPDTLIAAIPGTSLTGPIHGAVRTTSRRECYLAIYKLPSEVSTEEFVFTLAHEIFHCVQNETWRDQTNLHAAAWWAEGSAEYFANLALPGTGQSDFWASSFDRGILDASMVTLSYHNVVFFSWLHQTAGAGAIPGLLSAMPASEGSEAQLVALAGQISDETWQGFAQDYLSGRVEYPGGAPVPRPTAIRDHIRFPEDSEVDYSPAPFQIDRMDLVFSRDHNFALSNAANGLLTGAREGDGAFGPLPASVDTCTGEKRFLFYATSTTRAGPGTLVVTTPDLGPGACCLIGTWAPTETALNGFASFGSMATGETCAYVGGGWQLDFRADGSGRIDYADYGNFCKGSGGKARIDSVLSGSTEFQWVTTSASAAKLTFQSHSMSQSLQARLGPAIVDLSGNYPGPAADSTGMSYTCSGDTLSVVGMFNLFVEQADHTRVTAVP